MIHRSFKDLTLETIVNARPCLSTLPISMVALFDARPLDLCMVIAHSIVSGIFLRVPKDIGTIRTVLGSSLFQVGPL